MVEESILCSTVVLGLVIAKYIIFTHSSLPPYRGTVGLFISMSSLFCIPLLYKYTFTYKHCPHVVHE